jgi:hypothetical protein
MGKNPNTGQEVSEWNCAVSWLPMLLIEGSQQTRQAGSAIESFRNEMVNAQKQLDNTIGQITNQQMNNRTFLSECNHEI